VEQAWRCFRSRSKYVRALARQSSSKPRKLIIDAVVLANPQFAREILPRFYRHSNVSSFVRQLNVRSFARIWTVRFKLGAEKANTQLYGFLRLPLIKLLDTIESETRDGGAQVPVDRAMQYCGFSHPHFRFVPAHVPN
jgi:hypothetical protein